MTKQSGFTLVEVLIALLILAMAMTILVQSWGGNMSAVKKARKYSVVNMLLQQKVTEFEVLSKDKKFDEVEDKKGDFGSQYPDYSWEIRTRPFVIPQILPAGEKQSEIAQTISKTITKYFESAVKEIAITVIYKQSGREQKYTVTTLFVDYNQELPGAM